MSEEYRFSFYAFVISWKNQESIFYPILVDIFFF